MKKGFDVVCFGSAVLDAFVKTNADEKDGNILIPYGCKMLMEDLHFEIGGGGTNTAVAFSRLGLNTGYIGKVGHDTNGDEILKLLKKENVEFLGSRTKKNTSGFSVVIRSREKHRSILTYKGLNDEILKSDVKPFETKWLYLSSLMEKSLDTQIYLAKKLKAQGVKIAFNPSEYLIIRKNLKPLMKYCDVLVLNRTEAQLLDGKKNTAEHLASYGPKIVAITDAAKEVECYDSFSGRTYKAIPPKVKIVEKTGAGDAFAAGFVASLIVGKNVKDSVHFGIKEATAVLTHFGAKNNLIRMKLK